MQVTETLSQGLKREYKVVVNAAELDKELNAKLVDLSKRANIKGYRPMAGCLTCVSWLSMSPMPIPPPQGYSSTA